MANIQIIIDIPEDVYNRCKEYGVLQCDVGIAVKNGTPLPKGHGRLKDENEIKQMIENAKVKNESSKNFAENIIKFATTIVEADKEE